MKSWKVAIAAVLLSTSVCALPSLGQSDRGSITGTVTDPSGGVVANASVSATNSRTGEVRETTTTGEGSYTFSELPAAPYGITVDVAGFKTATQNVILPVQETLRVDFHLVVGAKGESVTVTSEAPMLQAESPVQQTNVSEKQVRELPLQVSAEFGGRTPLSFIFLDSSVTSGSGTTGRGTDAANFRVNGGQGLGTSILIDGAGTQRAQNGTFFSEVAPGPDAFQEFTVSTSSYSAEFGSSSGGVVNFTIKSGGNGYHGEVYDLLRNTAFNANSFINNANNLPRNIDRENDFGANIGGPIWIPKLYKGTNRTFFFFNYEGYRFTQGENVRVTVPTAKMRTGDFSELLTDPYVLGFFGGPVSIYDPTIAPDKRTTPIPGNRLDLYTNPTTGKSVIDPVGQAILNHFPAPTSAGVFHNYLAASLIPTTMDSYVAKVDQVITDRQHLSGSYTYRTQVTMKGGFPRFPLPFIAQDVWHQTFNSHFARAQYDYTISPRLLNHLNLGWSRTVVANMNTGVGHIPSVELGLPANATQDAAFPRAGFPGYGPIETSADPRAAQNIGSTFFTDRLPDNTAEISDTVTWVKGRHTLKFGSDVKWQQLNVTQFIDPGGTFNFRGDQTGSDVGPNKFGGGGGWPIASLLTGATEFSFVNIHSVKPAWRYFAPAFFANDDIKVTPRLTINVGVRYEIPYPRTEANNKLRGFDPTVANPDPQIAGTRPGALVGAGGQGGLQAPYRGLVKPDYSDFGPRLGFAYSINNKSVVRGGIGLYYAPLLASDITSGLQGYNTTRLLTPDGRLSRGFLATYPAAPVPDPNGQFLGSDVDYFDPNFKLGRTVQYSFDYQRELIGNFALTLGYIGSHGTRLRSNFKRLNAIPLNDLKLGYTILNEPLAAALANPAHVAYATSVGVTLPSSPAAVYPGFTGTVAQALRPFPQYGRINEQLESQGRSLYDALQVKLDRRYSKGLQFGFSYTFSKLITDAAEDLLGRSPIDNVVQNPFDVRSLRSVSPNNAAHVAVFSYLYELPFGKGRAWLSQPGILDKIVGGWQVNGIHRYQSGLPTTVLNSGPAYTDNFLNLVGYYSSIRPNLTGQPIFATTTPSGTIFQLLNPAAFSLPPVFSQVPPLSKPGDPAYAAYYADPTRFFGTAPPVIAGARALPYFSENLSVLKKTTLTERLTLEFRTEFFNPFNRHRYFQPNNDLRDAGNFGQASVVNVPYIYDPRVIQFGLKLIY
ncbi:MAG TPA: carboxypeptidase regulatory-like domain-containing protein [Candidatus Dormibacteraeota bacterium]|nr:carboxypeptidase regulatory-like domain-containing protein [Candidatus Dormibacteraeota bacterium]